MYLQLKELSKRFENTLAVDGVNIHIKKGELVSLLGPSGCGKTTTLKMMGGFIKPTSGSITLEGIDITHMPPEERPIATVFQSYALFPHMNVIENVIYGLKYKEGYKKRDAIDQGKEILRMVGLSEYDKQNVTQLSGGQQQRVALARALILNPKVLLLDEPLSNLDAKLRIRMRKEIKDIQKKFNITMLFVTHDQEEALSISDKILVMNEGRVEQVGTSEEIYRKPVNQFVADFIGRANILKGSDGKVIVIRPEHVRLCKAYGEMKGRILQRHFQGQITTYFIKVNEDIIQADVVDSENEEWNVNEDVYLSFLKNHSIA